MNMHIALYPLIAVILFASNAVIPQFGLVAAVFSPLVLLLYFAHQERDRRYDTMLVVLVAGLAVFNHVLAAFFIISPVFSAVFIRYCLRKKIYTSWLPATGAALLSFAVTFVIIYGFASYREGLVEFASNGLKTFMDAAKEANAPMTQSPYFTQIDENRNQAALSIVLVFPAFNYMYTVFAAFIALRLFSKIKNIPHENFRLPDNLVWALIASLALVFTSSLFLRFTGINFAMILMTLYAFQGFDIILFWMNRFKVLPIIKAIIFIFIFSEPPIILIISLVGLFSVWFNFYGRPKDEEQERSE
ncbi:Protein of unknown function DUF2232, membrane [Denitrovibrio acetiphilus DSM 12809]|uniref:DUF2232 domain-containing protein n=2 Tax=Denitrovibrio TaxID=117999 RepID=D4H164_DENA2|nr:Protein of unknown function DUF2232, membrane [Denitrovibrio acetiphilus DSM 12809]